MNPPVTVYGIPNCDSVKKARAWMDAHQVAYTFHDFKKLGVPTDALAHWLARAGWETLLNRKGTTWRQLSAEVQASMVDAASAAALMQAQPSVIKRPIVTCGDQVSVGVNADAWQRVLS